MEKVNLEMLCNKLSLVDTWLYAFQIFAKQVSEKFSLTVQIM